MHINLTTFDGLKRPAYILEESRLRRNLQLISGVTKSANVEIILAFKAYALWKTFPIFREYISATTASSLRGKTWKRRVRQCHTHVFTSIYGI